MQTEAAHVEGLLLLASLPCSNCYGQTPHRDRVEPSPSSASHRQASCGSCCLAELLVEGGGYPIRVRPRECGESAHARHTAQHAPPARLVRLDDTGLTIPRPH